jgi:hypothetical protein
MQSLMKVKCTFNVVATFEFSVCSKNQSLMFYSVQISTNYQQIILKSVFLSQLLLMQQIPFLHVVREITRLKP